MLPSFCESSTKCTKSGVIRIYPRPCSIRLFFSRKNAVLTGLGPQPHERDLASNNDVHHCIQVVDGVCAGSIITQERKLTFNRCMESDQVPIAVERYMGDVVRWHKVPRGFLRRSGKLEEQLEQRWEVLIEGVPAHTFEHFYGWMCAKVPDLPSAIDVLDALELAKMAKVNRVSALVNELADLFRQKFLNGEWEMTPIVAERGYQISQPKSGLRRVFTMGLGTILARQEKGRHKARKIQREEFLAIEQNCPGFAIDLARALLSADGMKELREAPACLFHDHDEDSTWVWPVRPGLVTVDKCPFKQQEWYPIAYRGPRRPHKVSQETLAVEEPDTVVDDNVIAADTDAAKDEETSDEDTQSVELVYPPTP